MKQYSFLQEIRLDTNPNIAKTMTVASLAALGGNGGNFIGKHTGTLVGNIKYNKVNPKKISWEDPIFLNVVKDALQKSKDEVKRAKEWYMNCDRLDKRNAQAEYYKAVEAYQDVQRDIANKNPVRFIPEYKNAKIREISDKGKVAGRISGTLLGGSGALAAMVRK